MNSYVALFSEYKACKFCQKRLPNSYEGELCQTCYNAELLSDVKDYIRENVVNEYEVASHFDIPLRQVKEWIREGRIEYNKTSGPTLSSISCQTCGCSIAFGTQCSKCLRQNKNGTKGHAISNLNSEENKMFFIEY